MKRVELLSPAGSMEAVKAAVAAGADAIYMGGSKFGARAYAESAERDDGDKQILEAIHYTHEKGKKFYLTVNTLLKQKELKDLFLYVDKFVSGDSASRVDAFIVQDLGVAKLLHDKYPTIPLHASTQMTICSIDGVHIAEKLGFKRIVLARELSLDEIKYIRENTNLELEVFVHGSMCYAYSGACMMSSFIGGQSGNRGRCKGPCRHEYKCDKSGEYILSMKDMCNLKYIKTLQELGIDSLKIEGRMRKPLYVAGVTSIYRKYIDVNFDTKNDAETFIRNNLQNDEKFLQEIYDKGGFATYLNQHNNSDMIQMVDRKPRVPDKKIVDFITNKYLKND